MILKTLFLFLFFLLPNAAAQDDPDASSDIQNVSSELNKSQKAVRNAAVKVERYDGMGYGSGTLMTISGELVVSTAAHVIGNQDLMIVHGRDGEYQLGNVIYCDTLKDIAFIHVDEMKSRSPVRYRPIKKKNDVIGMEITYTGFPNGHDLITVDGTIAGELFNRSLLIMQSYAWMGSSGSGVFNMSGEFIGSLIAVEVGRYFDRQIIETMVYVSSVWNVDEEILKRRLKTGIAPTDSTISGLPDYSCRW